MNRHEKHEQERRTSMIHATRTCVQPIVTSIGRSPHTSRTSEPALCAQEHVASRHAVTVLCTHTHCMQKLHFRAPL